MRVVNFIGHPLFLIIAFLILIIEGDHFGGNYILYLFMGIPDGQLFAIAGGIGAAFIIAGRFVKQSGWKQILDVIGILLMIISLVIFFSRSDKTGVDATFHDTVPLVSFINLCISIICFIIRIGLNISTAPRQTS